MATKLVLVVEDNRDIRDVIALLISNLGCACIVAATRDEGLERLKTQYVDLILTDYIMPGMGLVDFSREAARLCPNTPVLVYSAFDSLAIDIEALGFRFIRKPLDERALKAAGVC
ncbi:MAG TPA: response regulator [Planctomycetota bacterium]|nr:response regulator [Planctomycetota bacterium]